ncbi:hypothetical protein JTE90_013000 [Oedothorax gibbosus]|uniref:Ribosomal protein L2 n=1 Tax=Oedothorax gibbosus TaxID=931172 RepID=A0AAV6TGN4_9ARAC|nr:hypothetical protein JTE90_004083 [Oedothorax gibbosus]KAG8171362.1 hypothetical protein JTE90_013000 [Oedothorax gibbosus]
MGLAPTLGNSPGQGDLLQSPSPARSLLNATFPHALRAGDSALGFSRKKPFHHRGTPTIKGPLYLILPQKYCHKIKYETTSHSRQTVLDSPRPALHIAAGRGNNKGRKGRQASRVGHAHGIQLTPTRSPMLRSQYAPYSHRNNFRDGAARHGGRTTRREAET